MLFRSQLGGEATATIQPFKVNSTVQNLHEARVGERYEMDSMYPEFLREAKGHNNTAAVLTFEWALGAEKTHARLFSEAIALLNVSVEPTAGGASGDVDGIFDDDPMCMLTMVRVSEQARKNGSQ